MKSPSLLLFALYIASSAGCTMSTDGIFAVDDESADVIQSLQRTQRFDISPTLADPDNGGYITVTGDWVDGPAGESSLRLSVDEGFVLAEADEAGKLWIQALSLQLGDLTVGDGSVPPRGARLSGLTVALEGGAAVNTSWSRGWATGDTSVDLTFDWSLRMPAGEVRMSSQELETVPAAVDLFPDGRGGLTLQLAVAHNDTIWQLDRVLSLDALRLDLRGQTGRND